MNYGLLLKTAPDLDAFALIDLAAAKNHLRVDASFTGDDALIGSQLAAAIGHAEGFIRGAIPPQQWTMTMERFPNAGGSLTGISSAYGGIGYGQSHLEADSNHRRPWTYEIRLPKPPLRSVDAIRYVGADGTQTTLDADQYVVDITSLPGRIQPAYATSWPITRIVPRAVEVDFTCGFATAGDIPDMDKGAIVAAALLILADLYQNREAQVRDGTLVENSTAANLLRRLRYEELV